MKTVTAHIASSKHDFADYIDAYIAYCDTRRREFRQLNWQFQQQRAVLSRFAPARPIELRLRRRHGRKLSPISQNRQ